MRKLILFCLLLLFINQTSAYDRTFYEGNKTLVIQQSITGKTLFTIQQVSVSSGLTRFEEVFNITSYLTSDYTFSSSDIGFSWKQFKGNKNITKAEFFLFEPSNYSVIVDDYGINSTWESKEIYNNVTGLNDTVWYWDNRTVVIGNHTEIRDNSTWFKNNLNGKAIKSGKSYIIKVVFTKGFEKEFSIKTTPTFMSVSEPRMTWWNGSYYKTPLLVNNTGNASILTDFQVLVNVTYNSIYMDNYFTSFHLVNETSNTEMVGRFWIYRSNSVNGSYANIWLNLSTIPASAWDNTTYALYHRNVTEVDASNGTNTFVFFDDFDDGVLSSIWTFDNNGNGANSYSETTNAGKMTLTTASSEMYGATYNFAQLKLTNIPTGDFEAITEVTADATSDYEAFGLAASTDGNNFFRVSKGYHSSYGNEAILFAKSLAGSSSETGVSHVADFVYVKVRRVGTNYTAYWTDNLSSWTELGTSQSFSPAEFGLFGFKTTSGAISRIFDNFRIRKYASPESTAQMGVTESPTPSIISNTTYRTFDATWNTTVSVTWYFNGTVVQTNNTVTSAKFSNSTNVTGLHNITASGVSDNSASITWLWRIDIPEAGEAIREVISVIIT